MVAEAGREAVAVEDESVEQLPTCYGHDEPGSKPIGAVFEVA